MAKKVDLSAVMAHLIKEDQDSAAAVLHDWFVAKSAEIVEGFTITINHDGDVNDGTPSVAGNGAPVEGMMDESDDGDENGWENFNMAEYLPDAKATADSVLADCFDALNGGDGNFEFMYAHSDSDLMDPSIFAQEVENILGTVADQSEYTAEEGGADMDQAQVVNDAVGASEELRQYIAQEIKKYANMQASGRGEITDESDEDPTDNFGADTTIDGEGDEVPMGDDMAMGDDVSGDPLDDRISDLEAEIAQMTAEFNELMGTDTVDDADVDMDDDVVDDAEDEAEEEVEESIAPGVPGKKTTFTQKSGINVAGNKKIREDDDEDGDEDSYENFEAYGEDALKGELIDAAQEVLKGRNPRKPPITAANIDAYVAEVLPRVFSRALRNAGFGDAWSGFATEEYVSTGNGQQAKYYIKMGVERALGIEESFDSLAENYKLEPVKGEKLKSEGETTGKGAKVKVDTKSPVPEHPATKRVGGKGVKVTGPTHKGYERETAPKVAEKNMKAKNAQQELKKVSKEGDKSAMLNKNKEDKKAKSPINGDPKLRGNDMSR